MATHLEQRVAMPPSATLWSIFAGDNPRLARMRSALRPSGPVCGRLVSRHNDCFYQNSKEDTCGYPFTSSWSW